MQSENITKKNRHSHLEIAKAYREKSEAEAKKKKN